MNITKPVFYILKKLYIYKIYLTIIFIMFPTVIFAGNCDVTRYRWACDLPLKARPNNNAYSLVYCGNSYAYLSKRQYEQLVRYQRANVNMILMINGEYVDSPCVPAGRQGPD